MSSHGNYRDIAVSLADRVGTVEMRRPPNNFFDRALIMELRAAFEAFDRDDDCRALVLCAEGKHFCSGADFSKDARAQAGTAASMVAAPSETAAPIRRRRRLKAGLAPVMSASLQRVDLGTTVRPNGSEAQAFAPGISAKNRPQNSRSR